MTITILKMYSQNALLNKISKKSQTKDDMHKK